MVKRDSIASSSLACVVILFGLLGAVTFIKAETFGSSGGAFMRIPVSSRASAMGQSGSVSPSDFSGFHMNPAATIFREGLSAVFSQRIIGLGIYQSYIGAILPWKKIGNFAFEGQFLYATDEEEYSGGRLTGNKIEYLDYALGLGYSREFFNFLGIGVLIRYARSKIGITDGGTTVRANSFDLGIGVIARFNILNFTGRNKKNFAVGFAAMQLGTPQRFSDAGDTSGLPSVGNIGHNNWLVAVSAVKY